MVKKHIVSVLTIAAVAIGFLLSIQMQIQKEADLAEQIQRQRVSQTKAVLNSLQEKNKELQEEYARLTAELEKYQSKDTQNPYIALRLDKLKIMDGTMKVQGPGVRMVITDTGSDTHVTFPLTTDDLRRIINTVKFAGAEAISINGQRVIASTSIVMSGTSTILVNSVPISRIGGTTYEILAIGNQDTLVDYLTKLEAIPLKQAGMKVDIVREIVTIPSYKGGYRFDYAEPEEEEITY
ncbi:MAG: DUF881 domain-containing protein [Peptococcaceae bacterium]|jgi:uncharacterized protein YlxW (UPF0749 family)|nr:DUF881 domain-containing protein [Peptococcaceae bacterium]